VDLDRLTSGLQRADLIVLAGRPSMGKTALALNIAHSIAVKERLPVGIFSIEMSAEQLAQRLISIQAQIESQRLRSGRMSDADWDRLVQAVALLSEAPIFVDDTPVLSTLEMRSKARRLHSEQGLGLIVVDYLQLMHGASSENRVQEISAISRGLKAVARELDVPVLAVSQLSRAPDQRPNHEPMLSDLRESGCLTGESRVFLPDTGQYRRMEELVGRSGFRVLAVNTVTWKLEPAIVTNAFSTGVQAVSKVTTRLGRTVRATANHRFLTVDGWKRLDQLGEGERIAMPRALDGPTEQTLSDAELALLGHLIGDACTLPRHAIQYTTNDATLAETVASLARQVFGSTVIPRIVRERKWYQVYIASAAFLTHGRHNPVSVWMRQLGVFGLRSHEKFVPTEVFSQPRSAIGVFLRHLWATDGCVRFRNGGAPAVYYATSSPRLARDVQSLLLRIGISAPLRCRPQGKKGRDQYHVFIMGKDDVGRFLNEVGTSGTSKTEHHTLIATQLSRTRANTNRDVLPRAVWKTMAAPAMISAGITTRQLHAGIATAYCGTTLYKSNLSRERALPVAEVVKSEEMRRLAQSDIYWDKILSIEPDAEEEVYDLTVDRLHSFVANDVVVHNSIEQDADIVMFIYRDVMYNRDTERPHVADLLVAKHRNGPTGRVHLFYQDSLMKFLDLSVRDEQ
jgi:replicative DNA helicase